jgi:hypothetical protein
MGKTFLIYQYLATDQPPTSKEPVAVVHLGAGGRRTGGPVGQGCSLQ